MSRENVDLAARFYEPATTRQPLRADPPGDEVLVVGFDAGRGAVGGVEVRSLNRELLTIRDGVAL